MIGDNNIVNNHINGQPPVSWPLRIGLPPSTNGFHHRAATQTFEASGWGNTLIVTGLGGVGKTQVAAAFAHQAEPNTDLVVWAAANSSAGIVSVFSEAAQRLQLSSTEDASSAARGFVNWLNTSDRRWLVVLDDLADPADVGELWPPVRSFGCTVITTRRRDAALLSRGTAVEVDVFTSAEAVAFLEDNLGPSPSAALLAAELGYLPLALGHAVAYMRDLGLAYDEYRDRLADRTRRLDELFTELTASSSHARAVATTWQVSIDAANKARPTGVARPVLEFASQLDANGIPTALFTASSAQQWISARTPDPASSIRTTDFNDALQVLHRFNLVVSQKSAALARVHALVQRAVRESLVADAGTAAVAAADALVEVWPDVEKDLAQGKLLRTNAFALYLHQPEAFWTTAGNHPVLNRLNRSLGDGALIEHAIHHARKMCSEAEKNLGSDHPCTFRWRSDLASWQGDAGSGREAALTLESLVADAKRLLKPDDPITLDARANLAYQRGQAGQPGAAVIGLSAVADDMTRLYGGRDRRTLSIRSQMGYWLGKSGHPDQAISCLKEVVADAQKALSADDRLMLDIRHNYGYWLGDAGDPAAAAAALQQVLEDAQKALGPDHRDVSGYRSNQAHWRGRAGDLKGAVDVLRMVLAQRLDMFGPYHRNTLATWTGYLEFRIQLGERGAILDEVEQLVTIYTDIHGAQHHETLTARQMMASLRGELGDAAGAVADLECILSDREDAFADDMRAIEKTRGQLTYWRDRM